MTVIDTAAGPEAFTRAWRDWDDRHQARLSDPHGFLAITSLHRLDEVPRRFDDAPER